MALPNLFANVSTLSTPELDENFAALGALTPIPCVISGTDTLTLTPLANTPTLVSYSNYMQFTGICASTNTGPATATIGGLGGLPIFKDGINGPVSLTGGEMITGTTVVFLYDSTLNAGNGGLHLITQQVLGAAGGEAYGFIQFTAGFGVGVGTVATVANLVAISQSISWPALNPHVTSVAVVPFTGASVGDMVMVGPLVSVPDPIVFSGWVSTLGTVTLQATNNSASATVTPTAGDYRIAAWRITP